MRGRGGFGLVRVYSAAEAKGEVEGGKDVTTRWRKEKKRKEKRREEKRREEEEGSASYGRRHVGLDQAGEGFGKRWMVSTSMTTEKKSCM
jgi:hypothetical protein